MNIGKGCLLDSGIVSQGKWWKSYDLKIDGPMKSKCTVPLEEWTVCDMELEALPTCDINGSVTFREKASCSRQLRAQLLDKSKTNCLIGSLQHCEFRMRGHYHCLRPGCYFVTNITTKLPWHVKKHEKAERRAANGFKYFTKREECGRLGKSTLFIQAMGYTA